MVSLVLHIEEKKSNQKHFLGILNFLQSFDAIILTWEAVFTEQRLFRYMEFKGPIRKVCQ